MSRTGTEGAAQQSSNRDAGLKASPERNDRVVESCREKSSGYDGPMGRRSEPPPSDVDAGIYLGESVARVFESPDGMIVLVGRAAADNDILSLKLAAPRDFWLHVASGSGSHVVVRNPEGLERMPRTTQDFAAALAARYSKARAGGRVAVHLTKASQVGKRRGMAPGKVTIARFKTVFGRPSEVEDSPSDR